MFVILIAIKYLYILECLRHAQSKAIMHRYAYMKMNDTRRIISKRKIEENMGHGKVLMVKKIIVQMLRSLWSISLISFINIIISFI